MKQNKIKNQSCISTEKSIKSLKKNSQSNLIFFSKNHHHMNMIKMTGLKICNTTRESKREKKICGLSQSKIHCYIIHTIKFIWHRVQSFCFSKMKMLFFHWIYFQWRGIKGKILCHPLANSPCPPSSYIFLFCFRFQRTYETNIGISNWPMTILCKKDKKILGL